VNATEVLKAAAQAVTESGVPEKYHVAAFTKAVDLIAGFPSASGRSGPTTTGPEGRPERGKASGRLLELIAGKLAVDIESVREVYADKDGDLDLVLSPTKLEAKKGPATEQLAILLAAGRQAAGLDEWTETATIREFAESFKRFDAGHFARVIKGMGETFRYSDAGQKLKVQLSRPGWEQATALVKKLAGES
jgi:hypothetical protein